MIDILKTFFGRAGASAARPSAGRPDAPGGDVRADPDPGHDIHVATCALLLEMANIDGEFAEAELRSLLSILQDRYRLSAEHADALMLEARRQLDDSIDLWRFTNRINQNYSVEEKERIIEMVWRIVYADGTLDSHEDYLVKKLSHLLRLSHKRLIAAKLAVLREDDRSRGARA